MENEKYSAYHAVLDKKENEARIKMSDKIWVQSRACN